MEVENVGLKRRIERLEVAVRGAAAGLCPVCGGRPFVILPAAEVERRLAELGDAKGSPHGDTPICHCLVLGPEEVDRRIALLNLEPVAELPPGPAEREPEPAVTAPDQARPAVPRREAEPPVRAPVAVAREAQAEKARPPAPQADRSPQGEQDDDHPGVGFRW